MSIEPHQPTTHSPPHVLIFPLPLQGPVNCMLKLAELLCLSRDISVTFLNTDHIHRRLLRHTQIHRRFSSYPRFRFLTVPDGLPDESPRSVDQLIEMMGSMSAVTVPILREKLVSGELSVGSGLPVTVFIPDGAYGFAVDLAEEVGVQCVCFETISPCGLWTYFCLPKLIEDGEIPFKGNDLDEPIKGVTGTEDFLRRRDLPSCFRTNDISDPYIQIMLTEVKQLPRAKGLILNTFEDIDTVVLPHIRKVCPNLFCVGPIHLLHKARLPPGPARARLSGSLWEEDEDSLHWLDNQPSKSVVYVSVGSLAIMTADQMVEIWHGLVNSGTRFLWVVRPGSIHGTLDDGRLPSDLTEGWGRIVEWAPQEEVLAHPAVGMFLTHGGWNSTLESVVEGVPVVCWPFFVDQHVNSRFSSEVWKIGLDMKDACERLVVERMVREVMSDRRDKFSAYAGALKKLAAESVSDGGSSSADLDRLTEEIKSLSLQRSSN